VVIDDGDDEGFADGFLVVLELGVAVFEGVGRNDGCIVGLKLEEGYAVGFEGRESVGNIVGLGFVGIGVTMVVVGISVMIELGLTVGDELRR